MSYAIPDIPRSELGLAHDTRTYLERLRRREIWQIFETAKQRGIQIDYDHQMPKSDLIKIAVKRNVDLENTPKSEAPVIGPEPSIHDLRKMVQGLKKREWQDVDRRFEHEDGTIEVVSEKQFVDVGEWTWDEIKKLSKDDLRAILNEHDPSHGR